ncbi:ABC transporter permease [Microbacterium allomyrinae]|uniref:Autoinducer 2 import system permease protein LsrD n=1 Tax=Microbacterium allomyrinae TaxID=2830666 RepID=A0A9X1LTR0_9MICO|nr:ABC transporter permease [Microbacterium allomyrinae]MCC2031551.1 ABC transporter permease [Microbacterium allomyrinae]
MALNGENTDSMVQATAEPPATAVVRVRPTASPTALGRIRSFAIHNALWFGLAGLVLAMCIASPTFRSLVNLQNVLSQNAVIGVVACGMLVVMISGGFDMSVGASGGLIVVTVAFLSGVIGIVPAILAGIVIGLIVGVLNGLIVAKLGINSFISTLAVGSVITGVTLVLTNAAPAQGDIGFLTGIAFGKIMGVPWLFVIFLSFAAITHLTLRRTKLGHWIFATGANASASYLSGVPTSLVRVAAFTFGGLAVAIAAVMLLSQSAVGQPSAGTAWPLNAIAICVIGGTSLSGGVGRVSNVIAAALILGVVSNALNQLGISPYWQPAVSGLVILIAVIVDRTTSGRQLR